MLTRPLILLLVFIQSLTLSSNVGNTELVPNGKNESEENDRVEVENTYKELSIEQQIQLLLNEKVDLPNKPFLAKVFKINKQASVLGNKIGYIKNDKAAELWATEFDSQEGNLIPFAGLSSYEVLQADFVTDNPLNRSKQIEKYQDAFTERGMHLYHSKIWERLNDIKDQNEMETVILSTLRQMNDPLTVLAYDSLFEENSLLYKGSMQGSLTAFRDHYNYKGLLVYQPETTCSTAKKTMSLLSGIDVLIGLEGKEKEQIRSELVAKASKKPQLIENQVKRLLSFRLKSQRKDKESTAQVPYDSKQLEMQAKAQSLVCIKNDNNLIPIRNLNQKFSFYGFTQEQQLLAQNFVVPASSKSDVSLYIANDENIGKLLQNAQTDSAYNKVLIIDASTIYVNRTRNWNLFQQIIVLPEKDPLSVSLAIQAVFGSFDLSGVLPFFLTPDYKANTGLETKNIQRLRYLDPVYVGLSDSILLEADSIVTEALQNGTFPGCQVLFAWKKTVVYQKSFGYKSSAKKEVTDNFVLYDIASISKIAGSTCALMYLDGQGKFSLSKQLTDYLPELMEGSALKNIVLKDMMAHQAGLPAWIPFYTKTLTNNKLNPIFYSEDSSTNKSIPVATDLFLLSSYPDSIYKRILAQRLGQKKYLYSDLGYYFVKKIVEKQGETDFENFLSANIYQPLGLQNMQFNPYKRVELNNIAPTENDQVFRKQLIQGYVHDPGAAMLGGVGGHAGLFCNANDLAILMQMLLNEGKYGGQTILSADKIKTYTSVQFPETNRRGAGFDKPTLSGHGGTACDEASPSSYGHSGFTGTVTWADPKYDINYVFLSNRVNPDAENWKIVKTNVRTRIQSVWYKAVKRAQFIDYSSYL